MIARFRVVSVLLLLASSLAGAAGPIDDDEPPRFVEEAFVLPAYPKDADLLPFEVSVSTRNRFFVDERSISFGKDGVIRLTIVAESPSGVRNVSYEGFRCDTFERKAYAYGRDEGSWSTARNPQWQEIRANALNRQHSALLRDFLCVRDRYYRSPAELAGYIRRGELPLANR